jgi:hypothetical protein
VFSVEVMSVEVVSVEVVSADVDAVVHRTTLPAGASA